MISPTARPLRPCRNDARFRPARQKVWNSGRAVASVVFARLLVKNPFHQSETSVTNHGLSPPPVQTKNKRRRAPVDRSYSPSLLLPKCSRRRQEGRPRSPSARLPRTSVIQQRNMARAQAARRSSRKRSRPPSLRLPEHVSGLRKRVPRSLSRIVRCPTLSGAGQRGTSDGGSASNSAGRSSKRADFPRLRLFHGAWR